MCNPAHFMTQGEGWNLHPVKWLELFLIAEEAGFFIFFPNHPYDSQRSSLSEALYCCTNAKNGACSTEHCQCFNMYSCILHTLKKTYLQ